MRRVTSSPGPRWPGQRLSISRSWSSGSSLASKLVNGVKRWLGSLALCQGIHGRLRAVRVQPCARSPAGRDSTSNLNELPISLRGILPDGNAGTVAATVFEEQDTAAGAADAAH